MDGKEEIDEFGYEVVHQRSSDAGSTRACRLPRPDLYLAGYEGRDGILGVCSGRLQRSAILQLGEGGIWGEVRARHGSESE